MYIYFQGTKIHCTVPRMQVQNFIDQLKEGMVVQIHNFFVRNNYIRYITTDHPLRIALFQRSKVAQLIEDDFPNYRFTFKQYTDIETIESIEDTPLFGMFIAFIIIIIWKS